MAVEEVYRQPQDYELETLAREIGDLPFWQDLLRRERPARVLEIGCGCGRLTLPLARQGAEQGFTITGLEMEPAMLRRAKQHARAETPQTQRALRLTLGDARDLDGALRGLPDASAGPFDSPYDVILAPYGVAHHLTTPDDRLSVWRGARRWLRAGGLFAVEVTAPDVPRLLAGQDTPTPRRLDLQVSRDGRTLRRTVSTRYNAAAREETLAFAYHISERDGSQRAYHSDFAMHVYFLDELASLFDTTGFALERVIGSYSGELAELHSPLLLSLARAV